MRNTFATMARDAVVAVGPAIDSFSRPHEAIESQGDVDRQELEPEANDLVKAESLELGVESLIASLDELLASLDHVWISTDATVLHPCRAPAEPEVVFLRDLLG